MINLLMYISLVSLMNQIQQVDLKELDFTPYHCEKEDVDEIDELKIVNFVPNLNKVFMTFDRKVIMFQLLDNCELNQDEYASCIELSGVNPIDYEANCTVRNTTSTNERGKRTNLMSDRSGFCVGQLYSVETRARKEDKFTKGILTLINEKHIESVFQIAYSAGDLYLHNIDFRPMPKQGERRPFDEYYFSVLDPHSNDFIFINDVIVDEIRVVVIVQYEKQWMKFSSVDFETDTGAIWINKTEVVRQLNATFELMDLNYTVTYAVHFIHFLSAHEPKFKLLQLEIDSNLNLHISVVHLIRERKLVRFERRETLSSTKIGQFLNCPRPFTDFSQLKGIYFHLLNRKFYLFIDRFYLRINENLMQSGFLLNTSHYQTASWLPVESGFFESTFSKWIKLYNDQSYFLAYKQAYTVNAELDDLAFEKLNNYSITLQLFYCKGQTLTIGEHSFCFDKRVYRYIDPNDNHYMKYANYYEIDDLFIDTGLRFENQTLELIFNYQDRWSDTVLVLMTQTDLILIDYRLIEVDKERKLFLNFTKRRGQMLHQMPNCILLACDVIDAKPTSTKVIYRFKKHRIYIITFFLSLAFVWLAGILFIIYKKKQNRAYLRNLFVQMLNNNRFLQNKFRRMKSRSERSYVQTPISINSEMKIDKIHKSIRVKNWIP